MVRQELVDEIIHYAQEVADRRAYTEALSAVMDALDTSPPEIWAAVGQTIMHEGAYRMIDKMTLKEGNQDADHANFRLPTESTFTLP